MPRPDGSPWTTDDDIADEARRDDRNAELAGEAAGQGCLWGCLPAASSFGLLLLATIVLMLR